MSNARQWLESIRQNSMSLDLHNTYTMLQRLELNFDTTTILHVAGSNGKGSACALMAASLTLSGISNLMFTSPHISKIEERIRIDCRPIGSEDFSIALDVIHKLAKEGNGCDNIDLTFFETTFLVAMVCAMKAGVEVVIIETGLGGRLDATRCIQADACLLTSITREHTDILGNDLQEIIGEKAAIARPNKPIIVREMMDEKFRKSVLFQVQNAGNPDIGEIRSPASVKFISIPDNCDIKDETEILVLELFQSIGLPKDKVNDAKKLLKWPARLQLITTESNLFLLDAAHNPSGLSRVLPELKRHIQNNSPIIENTPRWTLLFATSPQQELEKMLGYVVELCKHNPPWRICLTKPQGGRYPGVETHLLAEYEWPTKEVLEFEKPGLALTFLSENKPQQNGMIVCLGSLYLQGNILEHLGLDSDEELSILPKQS